MAKRKTTKKTKTSASSDLYYLISHSFAGKILFTIFVASLIILMAILISKNDFDAFFKITGFAILVVTILSWLIYLIAGKD